MRFPAFIWLPYRYSGFASFTLVLFSTYNVGQKDPSCLSDLDSLAQYRIGAKSKTLIFDSLEGRGRRAKLNITTPKRDSAAEGRRVRRSERRIFIAPCSGAGRRQSKNPLFGQRHFESSFVSETFKSGNASRG